EDRRARPPLSGELSKIRVVYGGIDTRRFQPFDASEQRHAWGLEPEHFVFAVAGGYDFPRGKGQREFLQAAARIHSEIPQARFLLIGRGNMQDMLQDDIQHLGLTGKVQLVPHSSDMPMVMNAVDCLVHPAVGTEAFGLVVCEAHACGRPVIASDLDGIPEAFQVGGCGSLVPPDDVQALAQAMHAWATQPPMSATARWELHHKIAQRLSIADTAQRVLEIYQSLLPAGKASPAYEPLPQAKSGMLQS
ncbi:MAG: glycosyltransferase family 4 protein, partial [Gammaproteobacteria bacterium]|nr:glycosyltransferase family 4 protein [Gammaproteobacteria bacterium]